MIKANKPNDTKGKLSNLHSSYLNPERAHSTHLRSDHVHSSHLHSSNLQRDRPHEPNSENKTGENLLQVKNLSVSFEMYETDAPYFRAKKINSPALRDLNISLNRGEIVGVVGESGSGKSVLIDTILNMNPPNAKVTGEIYIDGKLMDKSDLEKARSEKIALIPQSVSALDPYCKVGRCPGAPLFENFGLDARTKKMYPHQLSGGMAKRVLICNALAKKPEIILADEPTAGLDVENAMKMFKDLKSIVKKGASVLFITHDISFALKIANRIAVFKSGTIIEEAAVENFSNLQLLKHEYSRALYRALPENEFRAGL